MNYIVVYINYIRDLVVKKNYQKITRRPYIFFSILYSIKGVKAQ